RTAFFMVLIPEKMAILDTERALAMFESLGMEMSGLVVNQVYPADLLDRPGTSEYLRNRVEMQQHYLKEIARKFGSRVQTIVPTFTRERKGAEMIKQAARALIECPLAVAYRARLRESEVNVPCSTSAD